MSSYGRYDADRNTIEGSIYSPPPAVAFCLNFIGRDWFGAGLKGAEALTFTQLMLAVFNSLQHGLLMSKKDAMRAIGAEHVLTIKRYAELAADMGLLKLERAQIDRRVDLLVPTDKGIKLVEKEMASITDSIRWAEAQIAADAARKHDPYDQDEYARCNARAEQFKASITVEPPHLEQLTLVADPMARPTGAPARARPRTFRRWIEAYSETLRLLPDNVEALNNRSSLYQETGAHEDALQDCNRLVELCPGRYIGRRSFIHLSLGNYDAAIADINEYIASTDKAFYPEYMLRYRARAYMGKKEWQLALDDWNTVINADPETFESLHYNLRGRTHIMLNHPQEALTDLEKAHELALGELALHEAGEGVIIDNDKDVAEHKRYIADIESVIAHIKTAMLKAERQSPSASRTRKSKRK